MRPRTPILVLAVGILLVGIVLLNVLAARIAPKSHEEEEQEQQAAAAKASEPPKTAPPADAGTGPSASGALVQLPADGTTGPADAKKTVVIGWTWTPAVQADPNKVSAAVEAVRKALPDAKIRVVNTDAVPDAPPGITVDGKTVLPLPPDGAIEPSQAVKAAQSAP